MPVASLPRELLERRTEDMVAHLPEALKGRQESVHQARVASRRLREALPVIGASVSRRRLREAKRYIRAVTRACGPVRELDVTLALLGEIVDGRRQLALPVQLVRRLVSAERRRRRIQMSKVLGGKVASRTSRALEKVLEKIPDKEDDGAWREPLIVRARRRADGLIDAIEDAGLLFDPARLHQVRIAAKKLRYALELAHEARLTTTARAVATLKISQNQLGRLHDLQVLLVFARAPEIAAIARFRKPLAALRDTVERECHREHARYLKRRTRLLEIGHSVSELWRAMR